MPVAVSSQRTVPDAGCSVALADLHEIRPAEGVILLILPIAGFLLSRIAVITGTAASQERKAKGSYRNRCKK